MKKAIYWSTLTSLHILFIKLFYSLFSSCFPPYNTHFKKKNRENAENYHPVASLRTTSVIPVLSKLNERCMCDQRHVYLNKVSSKWQCGFCQGHMPPNHGRKVAPAFR